MTTTPKPRAPRRHDLDALRGTAMLLGIAYHISLSFAAGFPWMVQDSHQNDGFMIFQNWVHGFRMPLFFILSGFFTAMLWRYLGLGATLKHRFLRIFLPLVICSVTIVPLTFKSLGYAMSPGSPPPTPSQQDLPPDANAQDLDLFTLIGEGTAEQLRAKLADGANPNINRSDSGVSALGYAAFLGHSDLVEALLNNGADANHRSEDGGVPLHAAAFLGRYESGRLLIEAGAEINVANERGETPPGLTQVPWSVTQSMAQMLGASVEKDAVLEGRKKLIALMKEKEPELQLSALNATIRALTDTPLFIHLWFLVYLCWFAPVFAIYAWIANRAGWKRVPKWLVASPMGIAIWIALTLIPQSQMGLVFHTFGPDTSSGFLPRPDIFLYYSLFFFFGALYFDSNDQEGQLGRLWKLLIPLASLVLFPIGLAVSPNEAPNWIPEASRRAASVFIQAAYAWTLSIGFIGLFRATLTRERPLIRYISDSSYWLYIIHMPLVFVGQRYVRDWDMPAILKFTLISVILVAFMLLTYHFLVRYTPIGTLLNGKRTRPKSPTLDPAPAA